MIDRRTAIGRMVDPDRVVYQCLICGRKHIGDERTDIHYCPMCRERTKETALVMVDNLVVRK